MEDVALKFWTQYANSIRKEARKYPKEFYQDLMQEAYLGILHGLTKSRYQDRLEETSFRKYLFPWARSFMQDYYHRNKRSVKTSRRVPGDKVKDVVNEPLATNALGTGNPEDEVSATQIVKQMEDIKKLENIRYSDEEET